MPVGEQSFLQRNVILFRVNLSLRNQDLKRWLAQRPMKANDFKCDQCDKDFKSENGLKIHVGKTHNRVDSDIVTLEVARNQLRSSESLSASPLLNTSREESAIQQGAVVGDLSPPSVPQHKCPSYLCSKFRCPKETEKQKRHWQEMQEFLDRQGYDTTSYQRSEDS